MTELDTGTLSKLYRPMSYIDLYVRGLHQNMY